MSVTPRKQTTTPPLPPPPPQPLSFLSEIKRFQSCWDSAVKQCDPFVISPRLPHQTSPRLPSPRASPVNEIFLCTTKQRSLHLKNQRRKTTTKNTTSTTAVAANSPRGPNPTTTAAIHPTSNSDNSYDDEKRGNEQWWLLKDLYEQEESLLPRHVARCIQTITQDYVLLSRSPQAHTNNAPSNWTIPNFSEEHVYQQFDPTKNANSSLIPSAPPSSSTSTSTTQQLVSSNDIKKQAISDNNNNNNNNNSSNVKKWAAARSKSMLVSNNNGNNNNHRSSSNNNHVNNNDTNNSGENAQQKIAPMIDDLWNVHDEIEKNCRHDDRANFVLNVMSESQPATFLELLNQTMMEMERDSSDLIISDFDLLEEIQCSTSRVLFSPKRLNIKLLDAIKETALEPIYCSVTIYEINGSECNKITESYSFEISSNESLNEKHAAIFKLSVINSNMMALFKFSRKYLGDDAEMVNEVYSKAKIKDVKSLRTKIQKSHESFPDLYSSFAWSAVNLKEALDSPLQALPLFLLPSSIGNVRDPVLLQQFLSSDSKKYKSIDGFITLTFSELMAKYEEYADAPEARIVLEDEKGNEIRGVPVKTLLPLNNMTLTIENNCLLLPHSVTISKEIKNIQIVASLQMDDSDIEKSGIPVFYTNYPEMSTEMQSSAFSTVSCNNTSPEFSSEMKLKLPFQPKESQNILFKFYNCTSKESLLKKNGVKKLVGYSYINLTSVSQGKVTLPIYKVDGKMSKYLTNQNRYSYGCFELEIVHRSLNFQSSDCSLEPFKHFVNSFQDYTNVDNAAFISGTNCLSFISFSLAQYVPMILNELVAIFKHTTSAELRTNCFSVIMRVVHKFAKEDMASILAYVKYYFNDSDILHIFLSETRKFMESKVEFNVSFILHNSWFLFSVLLKSLILHYQTCDLSESSVADLTLLFTESLASFIDAHLEKNIQHIGAEVGSFVTNLLSAGLSRTLILSLIYNIIAMFNKISTPIASNMLLCFMYHLFQFQNYLELCLPRPAERRAVNKSRSNQDVPSVTHRHFLFTNLVDCVMRGLSNSSRDNRSKACALMYEIVCQSTWDSRYQDAVHKRRINQMHFEFVQRFTEVVHDWNTQVDSHKKKIQKEIAKVKQKIAGIESNKRNPVDTDKSMRPQSIDQVQFEMVHSELLRLTSKYLDDLKTEDSAARFERQLVYGLIYHIIRNVDNTKLSAWLFYVNHGQQAHFLGILQSILTAFEFGKDVRNKKKKDNLPARIQRNMKSSRFSRRDVKQQTNTLHALSNKLDNSFQKLKSMSLFEAAKQHVRSRSAGVEDVDLNSLKNFDKNIGLSRPTSPTSPSTHPPQLVEEELVPKKHQSSLPRRARHSMSLSSSIFEKYIPCDMGYHILWLLAQTVLELTRSGITMSPTGRQQLASTIATVLTSYLHLSQPDFLLTQVMTYIRALVNQYPLLACSKSSLAPLLSESLLCLCNSNTDVVRTNAVRTEYTLLKTATLTEKGNALWPQVLSNLSISRLLQKMKNCVVLSASIQEIPECTKLDSSLSMTEQERLSANLRTLCHQMNQLILGTVEIACSISGADVYKSEYLLLNISKLYNIPELKVMWLMRLAEFHNKNQQYAECAQCYLLVIATILERMDKELVKLISVESFYKLSPLLSNRRSEPQKMSYKSEAHNDSISIFDEQGFLTTISKAINAFINAEQYEHCIPLFDMIIPIYQRAGDIKNVASAYHQLADIYEKIRTTGNERQFSVFYQVGFFGSQWGPEINCKQFIYKTPKLFKLFRMTDRLKKIYPNVEIISSSTDKKTLDDSKRYIQVTGVKPLINRTSKTTKFEESLNISQFYYEHAFSKTTKKVSDSNLVEIFKKKIIFTVDGSFPNVITRLPIINEQETILTPIEAAIDNIQNQIHKIEQVLETSFTDVQELQLILQGSVRAGVNGGPQEIVTTFLDNEKRSNFDAVHVETLDNLCHYFLYLCDQALTLNGQFIRVYKKNMQSELESGLNELKALFSRYIQSTKKFDKDYVSLKHTSIIPADAFDEEDKDKTNDFDAMCISLFKLPRNRNYHGAE